MSPFIPVLSRTSEDDLGLRRGSGIPVHRRVEQSERRKVDLEEGSTLLGETVTSLTLQVRI